MTMRGNLFGGFGFNNGADPLDAPGNERFRMRLASAIDSLPEPKRMLLGMFYEQQMNLHEIGAVLEMGEARAAQLHGQTLEQLRNWMNGR